MQATKTISPRRQESRNSAPNERQQDIQQPKTLHVTSLLHHGPENRIQKTTIHTNRKQEAVVVKESGPRPTGRAGGDGVREASEAREKLAKYHHKYPACTQFHKGKMRAAK